MTRLRRLTGVLVVSTATLAALELLSQILPSSFPTFEQWIGACEDAAMSTPLNHAPPAGTLVQRLDSKDTYGRFSGFQYEERYDDRGIKLSTLRPQDGDGTRILFMGDSFIEG